MLKNINRKLKNIVKNAKVFKNIIKILIVIVLDNITVTFFRL